MRRTILSFFFLCFFPFLYAQQAGFDILLDSITIPGLTGIQSFAVGQADGKWLIAGGRIDGLHRRQPFGAFDEEGQNTLLTVIDPILGKQWTAVLSSPALKEHLSATNAQFYQEKNFLYIMGGYGYSPSAGDHITYDMLTAIDVPNTIKAIINGSDYTGAIRQINDPQFAVCGGDLDKIYDTWYLVGGHKFNGRYNPMGPDHGPGFIQEYTNQIRKFRLMDDGKTIHIEHLPSITDSLNLHRRDYNVTAQIMPDRREGLTAFAGVFQTIADVPYMNSVEIDSSAYHVNTAFSQYYNHYHCANLPLYDAVENNMHTIFFGGIARYYDVAGELTQNNDVPFVKTIARVSRDKNGTLSEYKLKADMPTFTGTGAEFIPAENLPVYPNGVIKLHEISTDTCLLGYIYGGISSTAPNIFWQNTGTESRASTTLYKVFLIKKPHGGSEVLNTQSTSNLKLQVFPNTTTGNMTIKFRMASTGICSLKIDDIILQQAMITTHTESLPAGDQTLRFKIPNLDKGGLFRVILETPEGKASQNIVVEP